MFAYLSHDAAYERLASRFEVNSSEIHFTQADLEIASDMLDELAPFKGEKTDPQQLRQWPRRGTPYYATQIPDPVLDWVCLRAFILTKGKVDEGYTQVSADDGGVTFAWPQLSVNARRLEALLAPVLERSASR